MSNQLDTSVYPDLDGTPDSLETDESRADYVARIRGAWDYGIIPTEETFALFASTGGDIPSPADARGRGGVA